MHTHLVLVPTQASQTRYGSPWNLNFATQRMQINKKQSKVHFLYQKKRNKNDSNWVCVVCFTWLPNGSRSEQTVKHTTQTQGESFLLQIFSKNVIYIILLPYRVWDPCGPKGVCLRKLTVYHYYVIRKWGIKQLGNSFGSLSLCFQ